MGTTSITTHDDYEWVCHCGNEPHTDGFYPCDDNGRIIDPIDDGDWDGLYVCSRCDSLHTQKEG